MLVELAGSCNQSIQDAPFIQTFKALEQNSATTAHYAFRDMDVEEQAGCNEYNDSTHWR